MNNSYFELIRTWCHLDQRFHRQVKFLFKITKSNPPIYGCSHPSCSSGEMLHPQFGCKR